MNIYLTAALDAAARGWHVFPLVPDGKRPAVEDWENRATSDPARIERCWTAGPYGVGIACGPSRLVVVDLDQAKPDRTVPEAWRQPGITCGADVLAARADAAGEVYPWNTHTVLTGRGGEHLYFTAPGGVELRNTQARLGWLIDTRAGGGYVVGAGSTAAGRRYRTVYDTSPAPLPEMAHRCAQARATARAGDGADPAGNRPPIRLPGRGDPGRDRAGPDRWRGRAQPRALHRGCRAGTIGCRRLPIRVGRSHSAHRRRRVAGRCWRLHGLGGGQDHHVRLASRGEATATGGRVTTMPQHPRDEDEPVWMADVVYPDWPPPLEYEPQPEPPRPTKVDPFATAWTADRLMAEEFAPPRWAVPGLIPEGLSLLAGAPKAGKSWLALCLALGIAAGVRVLGEIAVDPGQVLYLALEDTPRRLQSRMGKILGDAPAPAGLTLLTDFPTLPAGGADAIRGWLDTRPDARMVVIDVFAKVRGTSPAGVNPYDADYAAMGRAKRIADDYGIAVVLVHHLRKMAADDFTAELSGTNGVAGAADTIMALKRPRGEADGVLHITGRDVDEAERAMRFDPTSGTWTLLAGAAMDHTLQPTRAGILAHLRHSPGATPKAISDALGEDRETIRRTCARMADDGQLRRRDGGRYFPPDTPTVPGVPLSQNPT